MRLYAIAVLIITMMAFPHMSTAAKVNLSEDPECRLDITGPIESGDFQKVLDLKALLVIDNGESTSGSIVCLDSPGGSLVEGLRLARFFLEEGVGTRIRGGKSCYSICSVMFMMGNARGPEVSFLDRRMHATSGLGFHRSYLSIEEAQEFTAGDIEAAYDLGIASVYDLMGLANEPTPWHDSRMIEPDLMQYMMGTPGDDMYLIRTVEQATRWQIGIDGLSDLNNLSPAHLLFACENVLNSGYSLTSIRNGDGPMSDHVFYLSPVGSWSISSIARGAVAASGERLEVTSLRSGYSTIKCEIDVSTQNLGICGYDESSDVRVGNCRDNDLRYFGRLFSQHPTSGLLALTAVGDDPPDAVSIRRCLVFDPSGEKIDDEACLHSVIFDGRDPLQVVHMLDWQSGSRTVLEIGAADSSRNAIVTVNGQPGDFVEGSDGLDCVKNLTSGNTVCSDPL